jgi:hypothetical protein
MRNVLLKYAVLGLVVAGCIASANAQKIKVVPDAESASVLSIKKARNLPDGDLAEKIEKDANGRSRLRENPDKVRQAFVFCVPSDSKEVTSCLQRVFITDLGTDETFEVTGEELFIEANRLVDNLKWINNDTLSYERWVSPHYGHRYVIDMKRM